jgi:hypothetical protein
MIFPIASTVTHAKQDACSNGIAYRKRSNTMTRKMKRNVARSNLVSIIAFGDTEAEARAKRERRRGTLSLFKKERVA